MQRVCREAGRIRGSASIEIASARSRGTVREVSGAAIARLSSTTTRSGADDDDRRHNRCRHGTSHRASGRSINDWLGTDERFVRDADKPVVSGISLTGMG